MDARLLKNIQSFETIAFTIAAGNAAAAVSAATVNAVVLSATTACYVTIGVAAVATASNGIALGIGQTLVLPIRKGERVSAIRQTADGNLTVAYGAA